MSLTKTFLFYDYETFGLDPKSDRIAQFAAIRTDRQFNIIEEPINLFCHQYDDYLPNPEAIVVTGITPDHCNAHGVSEAEFATQIHHHFSQPNSCIMGYNNIRFDDEMTRYLFYRNFFDPYAYSWQNGNSRWDLVDLVRATYALRPEGIEWPMNEEGLPHLTLEKLTAANGLNHEKAHDALSDVYGTIALAKLLSEKQPRLFQYYFQNRGKRAVERLISPHDPKPLVHISGMFGAANHFLSLITPIAPHPLNPNAIICADLSGDIPLLLNETVETLHHRLYTRQEELAPTESRTPLKLVHINRAPIIAPLGVLKDARTPTFDLESAQQQHQMLLTHFSAIAAKVTELYNAPYEAEEVEDVEAQLYDRFFSREDRQKMDQLRTLPADALADHGITFEDPRIEPLLFRYRAKNYPETLNEVEKGIWRTYSQSHQERLKSLYRPKYEALCEHYHDSPDQRQLLETCAKLYQ